MKLAYFGDIVGRAGRDALLDRLPGIRERLDLDFVVANGENAAGGFGISQDIANRLLQTGVDVISVGALTHSASVLDIGLDAA